MRLVCDAPFKIRSAEETEDGFLRVKGVAAKVGLLEYPEDDKVDRVTKDALTGRSLESMKSATLVMEHPDSSKVDPENFQQEAVGVVKDAVFEDGKQVVEIEIRDQDAIDAVKNGRKTGLSPGYEPDRVELDDDEEADRKQVGRRNNHLALTDSPRGEDETQLIVDSIIEDESMDEEEHEKDAAEQLKDSIATINDKLDALVDALESDEEEEKEEQDEFDEEEEQDEDEEKMEKDAIKREFKMRRKAMDAADKVGADYSDEDDTLAIMANVVEEHTGSRLETDAKGAIEGAFHVAASELDKQKSKSTEKFEESYFETDSDDEDDVFEEVGMFT